MPTKQYKKRHVIIRCSGNDSKASSVSTTVSQHWTITCVWSEHQVPLEVSSTGSSQWLPLQHMIPIHQEPGSKSAYLPKWWNTWENTAVPPPSNEKHIKAQIMSKLFFLTLQVMSKTRSGQSHLSRMITVTFMAKTDPDSVRGLTWGTAAGPGRTKRLQLLLKGVLSSRLYWKKSFLALSRWGRPAVCSASASVWGHFWPLSFTWPCQGLN